MLASAPVERAVRRAALVFVVAGMVLRVWQYAAGVSLWLDEIALARNILDLSLRDLLTQPLAYGQSAPRGFLFVEKLCALAFGSSELSLRLFAQLSGLFALIVFWRLSLRLLTGVGPAVAVALFAFAQPLIWFADQVKQYSSDVAVALVLLSLTLDLLDPAVSRRRVVAAAVVGALAAWFSHAALLVLTGLGACLLLRRVRDPRQAPPLLPLLLVLWGASVLAAAVTGLGSVTPETRAYLQEYWAAGLLPTSFGGALRTLWPLGQFVWLFVLVLLSPAAVPFAIFSLIGLRQLYRRRPAETAVLLAPVAAALLAAAARQYPFSGRLMLYLLPTFLLGVAEMLSLLRERLVARLGRWGDAIVVAIVLSAVLPVAIRPPVYVLEDMKTALAGLKEKWRPGDRAYVYYGAAPGYSYYASSYGFAPVDAVIGDCHRGRGREYYAELDTLRGQPRVWVVVTHANNGEDGDIGRYLHAIGIERDALHVGSRMPGWQSPVDVVLYDLSDPARLAAAAASSFAVSSRRGTSLAFSRLDCGRGPIAMVPATVVVTATP